MPDYYILYKFSISIKLSSFCLEVVTMKAIIVISTVIVASFAQNLQDLNDGRYYSSNDGQYTPDNSGAYYGGDDGSYRPDNSGAYVGDDSGSYRGTFEKYVHTADQFGGSGNGGGGGGGGGGNGGGGFVTGRKTGSVSGSLTGSRLASLSGNSLASISGSRTSSSSRNSYNSLTASASSGSGRVTGGGVSTTFGNSLGSRRENTFSSASGNSYGSRVSSTSGGGTRAESRVSSASGNVYGGLSGSASSISASSSNYNKANYAIIRKVEQVGEDGYHYEYETENKILGEEQGKLANAGTENEAMQANGYFEYTGPDNVVYRVEYTANENGFLPKAAHIPTPPPIPEAILRSLEYQRSIGEL